jgi:hypothetical protein
MTIGLVTVAWGDKYVKLLPQWAESVSKLNRQPDVITIVGDELPSEIKNKLDVLLTNYTWQRAKQEVKYHAQVLLNEAIAATDTDWIVKLDVDDEIFSHALDELDNCKSDIYQFGVELNGKKMLANDVTTIDVLLHSNNLIYPCSPFRKWVWKKSPFRDMIFEDWAFWIEAAANKATFQKSSKIDYKYNMSNSGAYLSADYATTEMNILKIKRELGLIHG